MSKQARAPVIGVTACKRDSTFGPWNIEAVILPSTYTNIIEEAGGQPILLPPGCCSSNLDFLDGLVVAGGPDIHPSLYGQEPSEHVYLAHQDQDDSESSLIKAALERDIPLLGICRGMQLMCVLHGGSMHQHLPETPGFEEHGGWNGEVTEHGVSIIEGSHLHAIMGAEIIANSTHHQGVSNAGSLQISAYSKHDNLIEGVERNDKRFCIGVQWHPERIGHLGLYCALVEAARGS
ncbi:MAG: gamma-glutamyl-gamma-aminobutyrate hydrolase [Euryarchaeota archaeon]|nr:gamma-glutamyl-gamma-aminobutyrate hydrolase [Euryarchaeota archaeon]|tara:strand:+ start:204 stop:908 length:705 start_codon:yes stop_codon:yes gene_type:complete